MLLLQTFSQCSCCSALSRTRSGASVESFSTPLKVLEKDSNTGEYIVRMSPQDFGCISSQGKIVGNDERLLEIYIYKHLYQKVAVYYKSNNK